MLETLSSRADYVGNDTTLEYDFGFKIFSEDHLEVRVRMPDGARHLLVLDTDYSIDPQDIGVDAGGAVTLIDAGQDWISANNFLDQDVELVLIRNTPKLQQTEFVNQDDFYPEDHEMTFDKVLMMIQELAEELKRCVKVRVEDYTEELFLPSVAERADTTLGFDSDGLPISE